jgi:hypothetical protein
MAVDVVRTSDTRSISHWIEAIDPSFREKFNRYGFALTHHLADHPLFELSRLLHLARSMRPEDVYFDAGDFHIGQRWDTRQRSALTVAQMLERIENAGAWIILRNVADYDGYNALINQCLDEFLAFVGDSWRKAIVKREGIIFVTSPNRVATYHIDRECSLLFQIRGEKEISVFDKYDREVITEEELERFWTVDNNAAIYKEQYQDRATVYALTPGTAVHIPVGAPHWVKNHDNVSISLNVNFVFHDRIGANIYRANHFIRKLGIVPLPPGRSRLRDCIKASSMGGAKMIARTLRRGRGGQA